MKVLRMCGSVPVTALSHPRDRHSLPLCCLFRLSNIVDSGILTLRMHKAIIHSLTHLHRVVLKHEYKRVTFYIILLHV